MSDAMGVNTSQSIDSSPWSNLFTNYDEIDISYGTGISGTDLYSHFGNHVSGICRPVCKTKMVFKTADAGMYNHVYVGFISSTNQNQTITTSNGSLYMFDYITTNTTTIPTANAIGVSGPLFGFSSYYRPYKTFRLHALFNTSGTGNATVVDSSYLCLVYYNGQSFQLDSATVTLQFWW